MTFQLRQQPARGDLDEAHRPIGRPLRVDRAVKGDGARPAHCRRAVRPAGGRQWRAGHGVPAGEAGRAEREQGPAVGGKPEPARRSFNDPTRGGRKGRRGGLPQSHRAVKTGRRELPRPRRESHGRDAVEVAPQRRSLAAVDGVPELDGGVQAAGGQGRSAR